SRLHEACSAPWVEYGVRDLAGFPLARAPEVATMISLEQLLDGLEVSVEPLAIQAVRRNHALDCGRIGGPTMHYALRGSGLLKLADGERVGVSARTVIVVPPGRQVQIAMKDGARRTATEVVVGCLGLRATSQSAVGVVAHV